MKRAIKLCDSGLAPKQRHPWFDPAYKYDYAWKIIIHNVNAVTYLADLDQRGNKTTAGKQKMVLLLLFFNTNSYFILYSNAGYNAFLEACVGL